MTTFTTKVEIAFNAGYSTPAASRTWTDVTAYTLALSGIELEYGRADERDVPDANRLRLTFKNGDGRFTPGLSSSPYYPNVKVGRPIRVTRTPSGGAASTRFVGYIDEWPIAWPAVVPTHATAAISASSRVSRLGRSVGLRSIVEQEILDDGPVAYYPLGEAEGATSAADASGTGAASLSPAGAGPAVVFGSATGPGTDSLTAATFADGKYLKASLPLGSMTDVTLEAFAVRTDTVNTDDLVELASGDHPFPSSLRIFAVGAGSFADIDTPPVGAADRAGAFGWNSAEEVHHVAATASGGTLNYYFDGELVDTQAYAGTLDVDSLNLGIMADGSTSALGLSGSLSHVAVYDYALSAARIAAHFEAGTTGFAGDTPADRIERYAEYAGIAAAELDLDTGQAPIDHIDTTGRTPIDVMRMVAAADGGVLYDDRDGDLRYDGRDVRYNASTALTLSVAAGELGLGYEPKLDLSALVNEVNATNVGGTVTVRAVDTSSQDDYGVVSDGLELATTSEAEIHGAAWWRVNTLGEPLPRVATLSVELAKLSTTKASAVLACNIGSLIQVTGLPANAASTTAEYFVEGYTETIGPTTHDITFNVSPAEGYDVFTVGDAVFGQYDLYPLAY